MMMCPCANCENTEPYSYCLNGMMKAEVSVAKADVNLHRWVLTSIIFCGLAAVVSAFT